MQRTPELSATRGPMAAAGCSSADDPVDTRSDSLTSRSAALSMTFHANLSGKNEVPAVDTTARGQITLDASSGSEIMYRLIVANITDVVSAHIHCAPAGANGPAGVTLFMGGPVSPNGTLTQAAIIAPDADNGCGWTDVAAVVDAIMAGQCLCERAYVGSCGGRDSRPATLTATG